MSGESSELESIELFPSPRLTAGLTVTHAGAFAAVWWSSLPTPIALAVSALVAASLLRALRRHAVRTAPDAIVRVALGAVPRITLADGRTMGARSVGTRSVHRWLISARLECEGRSAWLVIPRDAVQGAARHKALRRALLHGDSS